MYKKIANALYLLNIIFQSFLNLLTPIGLGLLLSYILTSRAGAPGWVYAPITIFGVFIGLLSMVKFILSATKALERLENEQKAREKQSEKAESSASNRDGKGISENEK